MNHDRKLSVLCSRFLGVDIQYRRSGANGWILMSSSWRDEP